MSNAQDAVDAVVVGDLTTGYGSVGVLSKISIRAKVGEVVAILGINGAGKSTLLNTVAGLHKVWSGKIKLFGEDVTGLKAHDLVRRGLVQVHEKRELFPSLSVQENLRAALIPLGIRSRTEANSRIENVYEMFPSVADRRSELAGTLSGGEQQMLALGRGLMANPKVLLLDEPSLGLNPVIIDQIYAQLHQLHEEHDLTIVVVEQHIERVLSLASRGYVIDLGKVAAEGTSAELVGGAARAVYMGSVE